MADFEPVDLLQCGRKYPCLCFFKKSRLEVDAPSESTSPDYMLVLNIKIKMLIAKESQVNKTSNADRIIIFRTKANRFETVEVSHEVYLNTPIVSVRRYRGDKFTGKGISLQPDHFEQILPEIVKAILSLRLELADRGDDVPAALITKRGRKAGVDAMPPLQAAIQKWEG